MELRAFAEAVLLSPRLEDKLAAPPTLSDVTPGARARLPEAPARPPELALRGAQRRRLVRPATLSTDPERISVIHAMANHELLALELFAVALLRFVDAPVALRKAWGATMRDEQRHLQAYRDRLVALGADLGHEPVSAFFWDALATVDEPLGFVSGMEVGLEQANLDFSRIWARSFRAAGDEETAEVLDAVHEDEVRHVRVGLQWLRRLKDPNLDDWDAWTQALVFPLTPARARGRELDLEARARAGFDASFVARLNVTRPFHGRTPRVLAFDAGVEDRVAGRACRRNPTSDLAVVAGLVASEGDVVIAPAPPAAMLLRWAGAGLTVPRFESEGDDVQPWGIAPGDASWKPTFSDLYDKVWAARRLAAWAQGPGPWSVTDVGTVCSVPQEVEAAIAGRRCLVKAGLSTAGQHRIRVDGALQEPQRRWLERTLPHGPVVVEPTLDVAFEISGHVELGSAGPRWLGLVRFGASGGSFRGAWVGRWTTGLPPEARRWIHEHGVVGHLREMALSVGQEAWDRGLRGPLGIDALVVHGPDGLRLKPLSEVNPRWTLGRIALQLARRPLNGPWLVLPVRVLLRAGFADPSAFVDLALRVCPAAVPTNDPATAVRLQTLLLPGGGAAEAAAWVAEICSRAPGDPDGLRKATAWVTEPCRPRRSRT